MCIGEPRSINTREGKRIGPGESSRRERGGILKVEGSARRGTAVKLGYQGVLGIKHRNAQGFGASAAEVADTDPRGGKGDRAAPIGPNRVVTDEWHLGSGAVVAAERIKEVLVAGGDPAGAVRLNTPDSDIKPTR